MHPTDEEFYEAEVGKLYDEREYGEGNTQSM